MAITNRKSTLIESERVKEWKSEQAREEATERRKMKKKNGGQNKFCTPPNSIINFNFGI